MALNSNIGSWVAFNGSGTVAILAQSNVTSITDNAVGDYTVNWTVAFESVNYPVAASGKFAADPGNADVPGIELNLTGVAPEVGSVRLQMIDISHFNFDCSYVGVFAVGQ